MIIADVVHKEPTVGDGFLLECGDTLIESVITELTEDGVVIQLDETAVQMLAENSSMWGSLFGYFDKKAGNDALKSAGYIVGVYHASGKSWDRISGVLGKDKMKTLAGALNLVKQTPGWDTNPYFREGAIEGINAVKSNDPSLEGMIRSKFNRIAASMDYLGEGVASEIVQHSNMLTTLISRNRFPQLPEKNIYENRRAETRAQWRDWTRNYYDYRGRNANDCGRRITNITESYIAEHYSDVIREDVASYNSVLKLLQQYYDDNSLVHPSKLKVGSTYDVVVIYLSKNNKTVEIDVHSNHSIKKINYIKAEKKYDVYTDQGLHGSSDWDDIGHAETLFFEQPGTASKQTTALALEVGGGWRGWTFSIMTDGENIEEGWRGKLGALGAAGILGAGAALSPSAYVNGVQYYYSDAPPPAGTQTKVVVDDRGRKIIVWTVKKRSGKEQYYYDPNARAVKESVLRFNTVELTESNVANYVQHYYRAYNIDRAPQQSISNFKKNNRLNESSDSELDEFISAIKSTDTVKRVAVGDKFAVLAFEINPSWKEIEVYGFAEPKEITRIVKHSDGRINFIEFADGDRYPRITQATHNSKPFMQTAYFNSADETERALSSILLVKPESYSINFSEYGTAHKLDEAEYRGRKVPLGKPMKGDVKKSKVYVKKPDGTVVKVNFGDKNMRIKKSNPARRKSFRARHNCANPGPRWKARYWSCRAW